MKTVELWSPNKHCFLPDLPYMRYHGSQRGFMYCGGGSAGLPMPEFGLQDITRSCVEFRNGSWVTYEDVLGKSRWYHSSWKTYDGIIWIGGESSER